MPNLSEGEVVVCSYNTGLHTLMIVCENPADIRELCDSYNNGDAVCIRWYVGKIRSIQVITLSPDEELVEIVIEQYAPNAPAEVKEAIKNYSMGIVGVAEVLAKHAHTEHFQSARQVENFVGWSLNEHSRERASDIWIRFSDEYQ